MITYTKICSLVYNCYAVLLFGVMQQQFPSRLKTGIASKCDGNQVLRTKKS